MWLAIYSLYLGNSREKDHKELWITMIGYPSSYSIGSSHTHMKKISREQFLSMKEENRVTVRVRVGVRVS